MNLQQRQERGRRPPQGPDVQTRSVGTLLAALREGESPPPAVPGGPGRPSGLGGRVGAMAAGPRPRWAWGPLRSGWVSALCSTWASPVMKARGAGWQLFALRSGSRGPRRPAEDQPDPRRRPRSVSVFVSAPGASSTPAAGPGGPQTARGTPSLSSGRDRAPWQDSACPGPSGVCLCVCRSVAASPGRPHSCRSGGSGDPRTSGPGGSPGPPVLPEYGWPSAAQGAGDARLPRGGRPVHGGLATSGGRCAPPPPPARGLAAARS